MESEERLRIGEKKQNVAIIATEINYCYINEICGNIDQEAPPLKQQSSSCVV